MITFCPAELKKCDVRYASAEDMTLNPLITVIGHQYAHDLFTSCGNFHLPMTDVRLSDSHSTAAGREYSPIDFEGEYLLGTIIISGRLTQAGLQWRKGSPIRELILEQTGKWKGEDCGSAVGIEGQLEHLLRAFISRQNPDELVRQTRDQLAHTYRIHGDSAHWAGRKELRTFYGY